MNILYLTSCLEMGGTELFTLDLAKKAKSEGKEVVSQSVQIHTSICPECGDVYVSGGTTRTTTSEKVQNRYDVGKDKQQTTFETTI